MKKAPRIIVRNWTPRKKAPIPVKVIEKLFHEKKDEILDVLYVGWVRKEISGKRTLVYLIATGETPKEARTLFKNGKLDDPGLFRVV